MVLVWGERGGKAKVLNGKIKVWFHLTHQNNKMEQHNISLPIIETMKTRLIWNKLNGIVDLFPTKLHVIFFTWSSALNSTFFVIARNSETDDCYKSDSWVFSATTMIKIHQAYIKELAPPKVDSSRSKDYSRRTTSLYVLHLWERK